MNASEASNVELVVESLRHFLHVSHLSVLPAEHPNVTQVVAELYLPTLSSLGLLNYRLDVLCIKLPFVRFLRA